MKKGSPRFYRGDPFDSSNWKLVTGNWRLATGYDAFAVRLTVTRVVGAALAALARAIERVLVEKQRSSARSTFCSIASVFSCATSEISEMTRNLARSSMRFSRNERFFDLARKVRLFSTSTTS